MRVRYVRVLIQSFLILYTCDINVFSSFWARALCLCAVKTTTMGPSDEGGQIKVLRTFLKLKQPNAAQPGTASTSSRPVEQPIINIKTIFLARLEWEDIDDLELARQLTLLEFEIYQRIQVRARTFPALLWLCRCHSFSLANLAWFSRLNYNHRESTTRTYND